MCVSSVLILLKLEKLMFVILFYYEISLVVWHLEGASVLYSPEMDEISHYPFNILIEVWLPFWTLLGYYETAFLFDMCFYGCSVVLITDVFFT